MHTCCNRRGEHRSLANLREANIERTNEDGDRAAAPVALLAGWWFLFSRPIWVCETKPNRVNFQKN
jgi:hypothetical protein